MMTSRSSIDRYDTTSRLLVRIASFASELIEYKYGWSVVTRLLYPYTLFTQALVSGPAHGGLVSTVRVNRAGPVRASPGGQVHRVNA